MTVLFYDGTTGEAIERDATPEEEQQFVVDPAHKYETDLQNAEMMRRGAYAAESDPIFFQWQRGNATEQEWLDAVQAIKQRYPYPEPPNA
jgi:hypothetical protein